MLPDPEVAAIAAHVTGKSREQIQTLRDNIAAEVRSIEAHFPFRTPPDDPGRFQLERDRLTCARRRREAAYLDQLLVAR